MKNFNKIITLLIAIIAVLTIACAVSVVTICISGAKPDIYTSKGISAEANSGAELPESFDYGDGYIKNIIFVGDKTISPISNVYTDLPKSQVWTAADGSLPLDNNLKTVAVIHSDDEKGSSIPSAAELYKPQYIIITVGIENGVAYCNEEKFKAYYKELIVAIKEASPDTKIMLQSIFPISKKAAKDNPNISNDRIDRANTWILDVCEESSVKFLNTSSALKDSAGYRAAEYDSGDGITLNADGYKAMVEYIRTHGYK